MKPRRFAPLLLTLLLVLGLGSQTGAQSLQPVDWEALSKLIDDQVEQERYRLVDLRSGFYRFPELPERPLRTTGILVKGLEANGFRVTQIENSVVGTLKGGLLGPTVVLRFEMDAIQVKDAGQLKRLRVNVPGIRHALGNDVQLTLATALARLFKHFQAQMPGTVRFLIESGSTTFKGAAPLIENSALESDPEVEIVIGLKMAPLPAGQVALHEEQATAAGELFEIELKRKLPATEFAPKLAELQAAISSPPSWDQAQYFARHASTGESIQNVVLMTYSDLSEQSLNPLFRGRLLAFGEAEVEAARHRLRQGLEPWSDSLILRFPSEPAPPVRNDPGLATAALGYLRQALGEDRVLSLKTPNPFVADDFSRFQSEAKTLLLWLGVANPERGIRGIPGEPDFNIDDSALLTGLDALAKLTLRYMAERVNEEVGKEQGKR